MVYVVDPCSTIEYPTDCQSIFLAGTIDNGNSIDWQSDFINELKSRKDLPDIVVFNPRRPKGKGSTSPEFNLTEQIKWELNHLIVANNIYMYIIGTSKSPISLLELGIFAGKDSSKIKVCCEIGYYRYTNVEVTSKYFGVKFYNDYSKFKSLCIEELKQ